MALTDTTSPLKYGVLLPPLVAAGAALLISRWVPLLGPLLIALILGAVVANTRLATSRVLREHARATKLMLRIGVVLLGLRVSLSELTSIGPAGAVIVVATVAGTYMATQAMGRLLRLEPSLTTLIAAGFSICGAAAIAAASDSLRARQRDVGLAIALVTVFGSAMIVTVPWLARQLGLSDQQAAIWAGASIHEVAQVAAAASLIGGSAVPIAMTIKLGRVVLLAPVLRAVDRTAAVADRPPRLQWFVAGFLIAILIRSTAVLPVSMLSVTNDLTTVLLAAAMFGLGLGIRLTDFADIPHRAVLLAVCSTLVACSLSLTLITVLT